MNRNRVNIGMALALLGASAAAASASALAAPPTPKDPPKPTHEKRAGLEAPTRDNASPRGGGPTNLNPDGPASPGGPLYRQEGENKGWRAYHFALYYLDKNGDLHSYTPGEDKAKDMAFPRQAKELDLRLMNRADRRALYKAERAQVRLHKRREQGLPAVAT